MAEIHDRGFKPTSNHGHYFPEPDAKLQTKDGRDRLERCTKTFETYVTKRKDEEEYFQNNKRTIFEARMKPRWAPASTHGQPFQDFMSDPNDLHRTSLEPLDRVPL